jgi:hypothetical protein
MGRDWNWTWRNLECTFVVGNSVAVPVHVSVCSFHSPRNTATPRDWTLLPRMPEMLCSYFPPTGTPMQNLFHLHSIFPRMSRLCGCGPAGARTSPTFLATAGTPTRQRLIATVYKRLAQHYYLAHLLSAYRIFLFLLLRGCCAWLPYCFFFFFYQTGAKWWHLRLCS